MDARGIAAIVVAAGVILWGVIAFAGMAYTGRTLTDVGGEALIAIGGALVGALTAYLASGRSN